MNKFSALSDFKINKAVAGILKLNTIACDRTEIVLFDDMDATPFDPCSNPADAMPIIIENGISILAPGLANVWTATYTDFESDNGYGVDNYEAINKNPLRAAMEVFLMIEDKHSDQIQTPDDRP